jgi:SAM-dependent methyltransferase
MCEAASRIFSRVASTYDEVRPGYPAEMYETIATECEIGEESRILEIGSGTGVATGEMHEKWNPYITAVEPGINLYEKLMTRFGDNGKITLENTDFENYVPTEKFDFVVAATAFHWVERKVRFIRSFEALKDDGALILFWNNYSRDDDPIFDKIQDVYKNFYPIKTWSNDVRIIQRKSIEDRKIELKRTGLFTLSHHEEFTTYHHFTAAKYVKLLKTFSKNARQPEASMVPFYENMEKLILSNGNNLDLPVLVDLSIAHKIREADVSC